MNLLITNILLAITWLMLTRTWTGANLLTGYIIGFLVIAFIGKGIKKIGDKNYPRRMGLSVWFVGYFFYCLLKSSLMVFEDSLTPKEKMKVRSGIIKVPLSLKTDIAILAFANCITLTPGTMTMDISDDKKYIYVHHMYLSKKVSDDIKELKESFEKPIKEIME